MAPRRTLLCCLQGHDEPFLEQWHQKLHTNTTPDDVIICEAYLAFLERCGAGVVVVVVGG